MVDFDHFPHLGLDAARSCRKMLCGRGVGSPAAWFRDTATTPHRGQKHAGRSWRRLDASGWRRDDVVAFKRDIQAGCHLPTGQKLRTDR